MTTVETMTKRRKMAAVYVIIKREASADVKNQDECCPCGYSLCEAEVSDLTDLEGLGFLNQSLIF